MRSIQALMLQIHWCQWPLRDHLYYWIRVVWISFLGNCRILRRRSLTSFLSPIIILSLVIILCLFLWGSLGLKTSIVDLLALMLINWFLDSIVLRANRLFNVLESFVSEQHLRSWLVLFKLIRLNVLELFILRNFKIWIFSLHLVEFFDFLNWWLLCALFDIYGLSCSICIVLIVVRWTYVLLLLFAIVLLCSSSRFWIELLNLGKICLSAFLF